MVRFATIAPNVTDTAKTTVLDSERAYMSKKKTPREKKEAAYERDHYTFAWYSPRGFRKTWKKKKNYRNRVVRRKAKNLLGSIQDSSLDGLSPDAESLTSELFQKGLTRMRLRKCGVVNLREKVDLKKQRRDAPKETNKARKKQLAIEYAAGILAFERDPHGAEAQKLLRNLEMGRGSLFTFLREHPDEEIKLRAKIDQLKRHEQSATEKAELKKNQKRKWRSPTLRFLDT